MMVVKLTNARQLNNNFFYADKLDRVVSTVSERTETYKAINRITKEFIRLPYSANNPDNAARINCWFDSKDSITTILSTESVRKFTKKDLFVSSMLAMVGHITKVKPTPLMILRDKLNAAVQKAWNLPNADILNMRNQMQAQC